MTNRKKETIVLLYNPGHMSFKRKQEEKEKKS